MSGFRCVKVTFSPPLVGQVQHYHHELGWGCCCSGIVTQGRVTQTHSGIPEHWNPRISPGTDNSQWCFPWELLWVFPAQPQGLDQLQPKVQAKCSPAGLGTSLWRGGISVLCLPQAFLNPKYSIFKYILKSRSPVFLDLPLCVRNAPLVCDFGEWPQQQMLTLMKYLWKTHL